ncbi:MAG: hypothetical protein R3C14_22760 [Caldilineaceae bacterium]
MQQIDTVLDDAFMVLTPDAPHPEDPNRDAGGRFVKGHTAPGPGRPSRQVEEEILAAVNEVATPERIKNALQEMFRLAEEYGSWKAYKEALTLALAYQIGRPLTRVQQQQDTLADILEQLGD